MRGRFKLKLERKLSLSAPMFVGIALCSPTSVHGQALRPADIVGAWHRLMVTDVNWDSATDVLSPHWREWILRLQADSTFATEEFEDGQQIEPPSSDEAWKNSMFGAKAGKWSLAGDTLFTGPATDTHRFRFARTADTLAMSAIQRTKTGAALLVGTTKWVKMDPTTPPLATLPPPTLTRAQLVGTWVATSETNSGSQWAEMVTDTVILRADSTWAANAVVGKNVLSGCALVPARKAQPSNAGTWYLGPANTVRLVDARGQGMCSAVGRWRGNGAVDVQGQQLIPQDDQLPRYTRVGDATP